MLIIVITLDEHGKFLDMEQMTAEIFDHHYDFDFYEAAPEYVFQNEDCKIQPFPRGIPKFPWVRPK